MLLDTFMGEPHFSEHHALFVAAPPQAVYPQIAAVTAAELPLFRRLMSIRGLPALVTKRGRRLDKGVPVLDQMLGNGFVVLAKHPPTEIVLGAAGRFWRPTGDILPIEDDTAFRAFAEPGHVKAGMNFLLKQTEGGTLLITETRVLATDTAARESFGRYWRLVKWGSGAIRVEWLKAVKKRAEVAWSD